MLLDFICIETCRGCRAPVPFKRSGPHTLCDRCWQQCATIKPVSEVLTHEQFSLPVVTAVPYDDLMKDLVHAVKYFDDRLIVDDLSRLLEIAWWHFIAEHKDLPVVVPVPLHWARYLKRGFNQSELLADQLCREVGLTWRRDVLRRRRQTTPHHGLGKTERMNNVRGAFVAKPWRAASQLAQAQVQVEIPPVLLLDDILTSGSTLLACAEALHSAGYTRVAALALCRA